MDSVKYTVPPTFKVFDVKRYLFHFSVYVLLNTGQLLDSSEHNKY